MNIILWVIFGALAGWVASLITRTNERQGWFLNIVVGIIGAFLGGFIMELLLPGDFSIGFNLQSFVVAVLGAVLLLFLVGLVRGRRPVS